MKVKKYVETINQIEILEIKRNLNCDSFSKEEMVRHIEEKSYFELINGFESIFKDNSVVEKRFLQGAKFEDFLFLYDFDRRLASELFEAIDEFENKLKSIISNKFCEYIYINNPKAAPDFYLDLNNYENPLSLHNRLNKFVRPGTTSQLTTKNLTEINKSISYLNTFIRNISNLLTIKNLKISLNFTNFKEDRKKNLRLIKRLKDGLDITNSTIRDFNLSTQQYTDINNTHVVFIAK